MTQKFEDSEILLKHLDIILPALDQVAAEYRDNKNISLLKTSEGKQLKKFSSDYCASIKKKSSPPKLSSSLASACTKIVNQVLPTIATVDYACSWVKRTQTYLTSIINEIRDLDLKWNQLITLNICKLFSGYCKIVLMIYDMKNTDTYVNLFAVSQASKSMKTTCKIEDLAIFVNYSSSDPLSYISYELKPIREKLISLVSKLSSFVSSLFSEWTTFNWNLLSIYECAPEDTVGNSMPIDELTYLSNINVLREMLIFFCLGFSQITDENPQYAHLAQCLFSESSQIYISVNNSISSKNLCQLVSNSSAFASITSSLEKITGVKNTYTHIQRMKQLYYLACDIENLSGIDPNQFLRCIHQIKAICALSYYEIDLFFGSHEQTKWDKEHVLTISKLLSILDKIVCFFINEEALVERFFVYNLSTTDSEYLSQLIKKFDIAGLGQGGIDIISGAKAIQQSIESLDLQEFDNGTRFDFLPLSLTFGRLLLKYNQISTTMVVSYLNPLFEHLMTIYIHSQAAQNSIKYFLEYCPIHKSWKYAKQMNQLISNPYMPLNCASAVFHCFSYFNLDYVSISSLPGCAKNLKDILIGIRGKMATQIRSFMNTLLTSDQSNVMKYSISGEIGQEIHEENLNDRLLNPSFCSNEADVISSIKEANEFIISLPLTIQFFGETIEICNFFVNRFATDVITILLFNVHNNNQAIVDAYQIVWTIFSITGLNFNNALFEGIRAESMFASADISVQAQAFTDENVRECPHQLLDEKRFVYKIASELINFVDESHEKSKYIPFIQHFKDSKSKYSTQYFVEIFRIFGIHSALYLDHALIKSIVNNILIILKGYKSSSKLTVTEATSSISSPEVLQASDSLLKISVSLTLRSMIRRASVIVSEEVTPGIAQFFSSINVFDSPSSYVLNEVLSTQKSNYFITENIKGNQKFVSDINTYFIFLGSLFANPKWDNIDFYPNEDALSKNLHLLPFAFELMVDIAPVLFDNVNDSVIQDGIVEFFSTLQTIIDKKNVSGKYNSSTGNPYLILVDKFPKYISSIEFGVIEHIFPYGLLSSSYPTTTKTAKKRH